MNTYPIIQSVRGLYCLCAFLLFVFSAPIQAAPMSGAIYTTTDACADVNVNIYDDKGDVYLNGGPRGAGGSGLPDGLYYVQVTNPNGDVVLGTSVGSPSPTPVSVTGGNFDVCYKLADIVWSGGIPGYDDTPNNGEVYKVWVSQSADFPSDFTKTDNFKVSATEPCDPQTESCDPEEPVDEAWLKVTKFYDANANGINDNETLIEGWEMTIEELAPDGLLDVVYTSLLAAFDPGDYTITESSSIVGSWIQTAPGVPPTPSVTVTLDTDDTEDTPEHVEFGNVCLGAGGGKTKGFWGNNNGQRVFGTLSSPLTMLTGLNLRNENGTHFDPGNYNAYKNWSAKATATNMAYMLSAQLAAMKLNVLSGYVSGSALVYWPALLDHVGEPGLNVNALGFITIGDLTNAANLALGANGNTTAGSPDRAYQEALKNAIDNANNNTNFVQAEPCDFDFAVRN